MRDFLRTHRRKALVLPPILLAVVGLMVAVQTREPPVRAGETEMVRAVRVIEAPAVDVVPRAVGFGTVVPGRVWQAVAEVSGRVLSVHPDLKAGKLVTQGTELLRFDPADYELALIRLQAQLAELDAREKSTRDSLGIEERSVEVLRRDLARKRDLRTSGAAAATTVDQAERALLAGEQLVQNLRTTLALLPAQRKALQAQADAAQLDLDRTVVRAPFDMRVTTVNVEEGQYAQRGATLAAGDDIATAEIAAQVPLDQLFPLVGEGDQVSGLTPVVRLTAGERVVEWPAEVSRISEEVDPKTRTVGVVVTVDEPWRNARPGVRPPLTRGMFVEVVLTGRAHENRVVIPRHALHQGPTVHVANGEDRLEIRPVEVAWRQGDIAVLAAGVAPGERVVVSDVIPAIEGLKLSVTPDPTVREELLTAAGGAS